MQSMNYAIIAAGEGSRLRQEGFKTLKPLVKVNGEYLIERLIRIFKQHNAQSISIIINEHSEDLQELLSSKDFDVKINLIVKSTPSSLHSFWNILQNSDFEQCCLTTIDTIFNENDFQEYISYFQSHKDIDALMGTTAFVDDEKPLYIQLDGDKILDFKDNNLQNNCSVVSAGIYCFRKKSFLVADKAIKEGVSRMRNYQRMLIKEGLNVRSFLFGKVIDIDHLQDIGKAEKLIKNNSIDILAIQRSEEYSPNSQDKDLWILQSIVNQLKNIGYNVSIKNENKLDFSKDFTSYIISMARNPEVIDRLAVWEKQGATIVNSPLSCINCYRETQTRIFIENNISIAPSQIIDTYDFKPEILHLPTNNDFWIKRADFQTIEPIDVIRVASFKEAQEVLKNYFKRGISRSVISSHIEGNVIKFYGVKQNNWFYYYYPKEDKFHNKINQTDRYTAFDEKALVEMCQRAANLLDLDIYGGDAVIDSEGKIYIIDMNDFPSFSSCKEIAAEQITKAFVDKCKIR